MPERECSTTNKATWNGQTEKLYQLNLHKDEWKPYNDHDAENINWHIIGFYLRSSTEEN